VREGVRLLVRYYGCDYVLTIADYSCDYVLTDAVDSTC